MKDDVIKLNIAEAIKLHPALYDCNISVHVQKGAATLDGYVHNYEEKIIATQIAERTRGVQSVKQNLEVRYPAAKAMPTNFTTNFR